MDSANLPFTREGGWGHNQFMGTGAPFDAELGGGGMGQTGAGMGGISGGLFGRNNNNTQNGHFTHAGGVQQV